MENGDLVLLSLHHHAGDHDDEIPDESQDRQSKHQEAEGQQAYLPVVLLQCRKRGHAKSGLRQDLGRTDRRSLATIDERWDMPAANAIAVQDEIPDRLIDWLLLREYPALEGGLWEEQHILERRGPDEPVLVQVVARSPHPGNPYGHLHAAIRLASNIDLARL